MCRMMVSPAMTDMLLRKTSSGFVPLDDIGQEYWDSLGLGDVIKCKVSKPRNYKFLQKYWACVRLVFKNQRYFPSQEVLHGAIKQATGYATTYEFKNGQTYTHIGSISFAKMDEVEFEIFYKTAIRFICENVIPGLKEEDLVRELLSF